MNLLAANFDRGVRADAARKAVVAAQLALVPSHAGMFAQVTAQDHDGAPQLAA